ncbi:MAG: zinc ribbon domain-containing protein [Myxococcales bacterium]|nr:zinc ribbon domain-containing protein [Myxococcales bacterium]
MSEVPETRPDYEANAPALEAFSAPIASPTCPHCGASAVPGGTFCDGCGQSLSSSDDSYEYEMLHRPALDRARKWILIVGIIYFVSGVLLGLLAGEAGGGLIFGLNLVLALIHVGLWHWARIAPFPAAVAALVLFSTVHLLEFVVDPSSIARGLLLKIIFLSILGSAVKAGLDARRLRLGAP